MIPSRAAGASGPELESALSEVESGLGSLQTALQADDPSLVERAAQDLERAL